ncbi:MAG: sodium-dependent transporter [Eggerthellaceae bacterium]
MSKEIETQQETKQWGSRFGYIMVAAGAAVGLGNIWKFPYLAYNNGGGAFMIGFIVCAILLAYPMVKIETAIGRAGRGDTVGCYKRLVPKSGFIGWVATICTLLINFFYVVVGGWVLKYAVTFIVSGSFEPDALSYFTAFTTSPVEPIIWAFILLAGVSIMLLFGITNIVEKAVKVIMPCLVIFLIGCGIWALFVIDGAVEGLKFYFIPDFSNFTFTTFAACATQTLFSVGIGWGIFTTLGANVPKSNNIKADSAMIVACDVFVAILAGFVVIPSAFASGTDFQAGPRLVFEIMTGVFGTLPGGRIIGSFFFVALLFAVISSLFTFFEIPMRVFEQELGLGRKKGVAVVALIILVGNIFVSLGFGPLSEIINLPWPNFQGLEHYGLYDWIDCFTAYILLPLGVVFEAMFIWKAWKFVRYEKEMTNDGELKPMSKLEKFDVVVICPLMMVIVFLYVFGFIS